MNLFYLADAKYGGWPTFTAHLFHGLVAAGHEPALFKVGKKTETRMRPYGRGIEYQNVSLDAARMLADGVPSLITAASPKRADDARAILESGAGIVVHDPTELKAGLPDALAAARVVLVIRASMRAHLPDARLMPHPYMPLHPKRHVAANAVAFSRVDFDKHTDIIVQANELLLNGERCQIYGSVNRMYEHHKLAQAHPEWRKFYRRDLPAEELHAGAKLAAASRYVVDMSAIVGDGGGTQYTFLEAMDGGATLVLNEAWRTGPDDEMEDYAIYVDGPEELANVLRVAHRPTPNYELIMARHDATSIARRLVKTLEV